jgi:hypothetical protein
MDYVPIYYECQAYSYQMAVHQAHAGMQFSDLWV